jgi:hypothetical protein
LANGVEEAKRIVTSLQQKGLTIRLLGGIAVNLLCPNATHRALNRTYADIDLVGLKKQSRQLRDGLTELGYVADRRFNALHGEHRLLFFDEGNARQLDVFLGVFEMCHKLVLDQRLALNPLTLSPADLLLTKLQIVQLNAKDIQDMLALLLDYPPQEAPVDPGRALDMRIITSICSQDWGWYTTVNDNLERVAQEATHYLDPEETAVVQANVERMRQHLAAAPKSAGWKLRAIAGKRIPWYELPEEVRR